MLKSRICHITTVHVRYDIRIFKKECISLSKAGYNVFLVVADGLGDEICEGINIIDTLKGKKKIYGNHINNNIYKPGSRLRRIIINTYKSFWSALEIKADVYHFHDPELIFYGLILKKLGKKVIYDVHENISKQILSKPYIMGKIAKLLSIILGWFERYAAKKFDAVIAATESIENTFSKLKILTKVIHNYPFKQEFKPKVYKNRNAACYIGSITPNRSALQLVQAAEHTNCKIILAGDFYSNDFADKLKSQPGWSNIDYRGLVRREILAEILENCFAGLVLFADEPNHKEALPNKIFEYMSAAIPVIGSKFPYWVELIERNGFGLCVDPKNPYAIAEAINYLYMNSGVAISMGKRGRSAIELNYNWEKEKNALIELYNTLTQ